MGGPEHDPVLDALDALVEALHQNIAGDRDAVERAAHIRDERARGLSYRAIVSAEEPPLIVERVRESLDRLARHGAQFRRAEAHALHAEGMTMDEIAALFGVTRQRVSALLRGRGATDASPSP